MRCKICQTDGHSFIYKGKSCCSDCYDRFFGDSEGKGYIFADGELAVLWVNLVDINEQVFSIFFHYDKEETAFVKKDKEVLVFKEVKPATDEFFQKAAKQLPIWQTFS